MKRLYVLLCFVVACSGYVKAQEKTPPAIDFEDYLAKMDTIMHDSIYRVDTLYYPWEKNVQMIELRWKTVRKKNLYSFNLFAELPNIFIFRDKKGNFINVYNNINNFNIDSKAFKKTSFINSNKFPHKYIFILESITHEHVNYESPYFYRQLLNSLSVKKGIINSKGEVLLPCIYEDIFMLPKMNAIVLNLFYKQRSKNNREYRKYNDLTLIENYDKIFNDEHVTLYRNYEFYLKILPNVVVENISTLFFKSYETVRDSVNGLLIKNDVFILSTSNKKVGVVDKKINTVIPYIYDSIYLHYYTNKVGEKDYFFRAYKQNKIKILDKYNNILMDTSKYDNIKLLTNYLKNEYVFLVEKNNKWGLYNDKYEMVMPIIYDSIIVQSNQLQVLKDKKWAIYNSDYQVLIEGIIDVIEPIMGGYLLSINNNKSILYGLSDKALKHMPINYALDSVKYISLTVDNNVLLQTYYQDRKIEVIELID